MAKRKISIDELKRILDRHRLWVASRGKEGERAYLEGADLEGADLEGADLEGADLESASLLGANLRRANLEDTNLRGANLQGANLQDAILRYAILLDAILEDATLDGAHLEGAIGLIPHLSKRGPIHSTEVRRSEEQVRAAERRIADLEEQLQAAAADSDEKKELASQLQAAETKRETALVEIEALQNKLDEKLSENVQTAIEVLKKSLAQTTTDIDSYRATSKWLTGFGVFAVVAAFVVTPIVWFCYPPPAVPEWFDYFARFGPAGACFLAATTLLRHDAKLRQRYEHLSIQQHRVELAGGLLEAATELSKVEGLQNLAPIPETFSHILRQTLGPDPGRTGEQERETDISNAVASQTSAAIRKGLGPGT